MLLGGIIFMLLLTGFWPLGYEVQCKKCLARGETDTFVGMLFAIMKHEREHKKGER